MESVTAIVDGIELYGQQAQLKLLEFYMGPAGSGSQLHWHHTAINVQAYGRKRWFLFPPGNAVFATKPILRWLLEDYPRGVPSRPLECVQEPGDVIFVPIRWAH